MPAQSAVLISLWACGGHPRRESLAVGAREGVLNDFLCFRLDSLQVMCVLEALGVQLVDVLCPRRARSEPPSFRDHFHSANWFVVARRGRQNARDLLAGQF